MGRQAPCRDGTGVLERANREGKEETKVKGDLKVGRYKWVPVA